MVHTDLATGGAEAGFAGEGDEKLVLTARANIASVATVRVATEHQSLDDLANVTALVSGEFVFEAQVARAVQVVEEEALYLQHIGGSDRDRWDGRGDATRVGLRRMKPDSDRVSRTVSFSCAKCILDYNISA